MRSRECSALSAQDTAAGLFDKEGKRSLANFIRAATPRTGLCFTPKNIFSSEGCAMDAKINRFYREKVQVMDDATATMIRAKEIRDREHKVRFVADYMLRSTREWRGIEWDSIPNPVRLDYLHDARCAIEACTQWDSLYRDGKN